ncbi:class I SAM-dependent methyltransferase [Trebonia kvetii]|uniref:Class I SAM-dependent methyltransferase n=1 Tax=Trebonia kvetii TaxID=2480626 RepID=A0A6P2C1Y3_9ACTN|nr:class I SAM-dependent methyltransferase [Trebonia kvetii]TVZ05384.1 class I SAM-dependent methyltransferase [Trebonia kvetii]
MDPESAQDQVLAEQRAYYSALAPDYLDQLLDLPGGAELADALEEFRPEGSVLDLACGPGTWTPQLLRHANDVTAVDELERRLRELGWDITVTPTAGPFYWGAGTRQNLP